MLANINICFGKPTADPYQQPDDGWQVQQQQMIRGGAGVSGLGTKRRATTDGSGSSKSKLGGSKKSGKSKSFDATIGTAIIQDHILQTLGATAQQTVIFTDGFEAPAGLNGWVLGGDDAERIDGTWGNVRNGDWALRLRHNTPGSIATKAVNVQAYTKVALDFYFKPKRMTGAAESFHLDVQKDGGAYLPVKEWTPQDIVEGQYNRAQVNIDVDGVDDIILRFRCMGDTDKDRIFLDDITAIGTGTGPPPPTPMPTPPGPSPQPVELFFNGFETGWEGWMDGGVDASRIDGDTWGNARTDRYALRLMDNTAESTVTKDVNVELYDQITVDFYFKPKRMLAAAESFHLDVQKDGGVFLPLKTWAPQDMVEDQWNRGQVQFDVTAVASITIRLRCMGDTDRDRVFVDDITVTAIPSANTMCPADREGPNCEFAAQTYRYTTDNNDCNVRVTDGLNGPDIIEHEDNVVIKFWAFGDMPYDQEASSGNKRSCCQESGGLVGCVANQDTCDSKDCGTDPDLTNNACSFGGTSFRCAPGCVFEGREYDCWRKTIVPYMNANAQDSVASFGFFAGDFLKGNGGGDSGFCNPDSFASRRALFDSMNVDVLFTPGDNDWNECNGFDSSNNNVIRRMYRSFFTSQTTFSRDFRSKVVQGYPARPSTIFRDTNYPELFYYVWNDVVFIGVSAPAGWEPPNGRNKSWIRDSLAKIDNDYPNFANEAEVCTNIRSVVLLSHTRYFNDARPEINSFFASCGRGGGAVPLLNVKGNHHDYEYCQRGGSSSNNFEMVSGGDQGTSGNNEESDPHLVTILRDPRTGDHYFRVDRNDDVSNSCSGFN